MERFWWRLVASLRGDEIGVVVEFCGRVGGGFGLWGCVESDRLGCDDDMHWGEMCRVA